MRVHREIAFYLFYIFEIKTFARHLYVEWVLFSHRTGEKKYLHVFFRKESDCMEWNFFFRFLKVFVECILCAIEYSVCLSPNSNLCISLECNGLPFLIKHDYSFFFSEIIFSISLSVAMLHLYLQFNWEKKTTESEFIDWKKKKIEKKMAKFDFIGYHFFCCCFVVVFVFVSFPALDFELILSAIDCFACDRLFCLR